MSGIFQRISTIFSSKANKALDRAEDPRETLDYSYQRQLELLQKVRRGVADVATSRKRVELQATQLNGQAEKLQMQAQRALEAGREDLAREALTRKSGLQQQLGDLQVQHAQLQGEEEKLIRASQRLQAKVDAFRTRKETIKASYSAAEAQTRINEAFSGISEEMGDVGLAIQRAEDKTLQLQARAGAVDELLASGALEDSSGMMRDDITRELDQLASTSEVENELEALKSQLSIDSGAGSAPRGALGPGQGQPQQAPAGQAQAQQPPTGQGGQPPYQGPPRGQAYQAPDQGYPPPADQPPAGQGYAAQDAEIYEAPATEQPPAGSGQPFVMGEGNDGGEQR